MAIIIFSTILIFLFLCLFFLSMNVKLPLSERDSPIMRPFKRVAYLILRTFPIKSFDEMRKNELLLNPAGDGLTLTNEYFSNKLAEALIIVFVGNLVVLGLNIASFKDSQYLEKGSISRNGYGEGDSSMTLEVWADNEKLSKEMDIRIPERQYTSEEINEVFEKIEKRVEEEVFKDGLDPEHICRDLNLPERIDDFPVSITWESDNYSVINGEGKLGEEIPEEGAVAELKAILTYYDVYDEYSFFVRIYPKELEGEERIREAIKRKIDKRNSETISGPALILPRSADGKTLNYKRARDRTAEYLFFLVILVAIVIYYGRDNDIKKQVENRNKEMVSDYPDILSKLCLLIGAGMTIRGAFEKVANDYLKKRKAGRIKASRFAYEEMVVSVHEMRSGVSEAETYENFAQRCGVHQYTKLGTLLQANLKKGSAGLVDAMRSEVINAFEDRKALARRLGEEAGTKLLMPMGMMLVVVMIIVILPAFLSFSL
ncbi:MAG: hypothetical protein J6P05_01485 [Lachnospiraceae bacterium]|nr:hypothetical protein [Lachnospiraceae bacterium]